MVSSSTGMLERQNSRSGVIPRPRISFTQCCVGLVFCASQGRGGGEGRSRLAHASSMTVHCMRERRIPVRWSPARGSARRARSKSFRRPRDRRTGAALPQTEPTLTTHTENETRGLQIRVSTNELQRMNRAQGRGNRETEGSDKAGSDRANLNRQRYSFRHAQRNPRHSAPHSLVSRIPTTHAHTTDSATVKQIERTDITERATELNHTHVRRTLATIHYTHTPETHM